MTIRIDKKEYYNVPKAVGKAIEILLDECANDKTEIVSAEEENNELQNEI